MCARKIRVIELSGTEEIVQKPSKLTPKPKEQQIQVITTSEATKTQESIMETTHQPIATQPVEQKRRRGRPRKNETIQSTSSLPLRRRLSGRKPAPKMGLNAETIQVVTEFIQKHGGFENATTLIRDLRELEISLGGLDAINKHLEIIGLILRIDR